MNLITWNKSYSVKVDSIDEQHKKLIYIINELYSSMKEGKSKEHIGEILQEVLDYTKYHFSYEEGLMEKAGYKALAEHKKIHSQFVAEIEKYCERHKKGDAFLSFDVSETLFNWLVKHIKGTDFCYIDKMKESGIN